MGQTLPASPASGTALIAVLGAGSLGRLWAATLTLGGQKVVFVPRSPASTTGSPVRFDFLPLGGHIHAIQIPWLQPEDTPSLVLVTTKALDVGPALSRFLPGLPETVPVVLFQNGMGSQQEAAETWPDRPLLAASTTEGANRPEAGVCVHAGSGSTWVGALTSAAIPRLHQVTAILEQSGLTVLAEQNIRDRLWQKLVINAGINPYTALLDCPNGELPKAPLFQQTIGALCQEIHSLMLAEGLQSPGPESLQEKIETVIHATAANTSSMRADRLAGRRTEIDVINGYLVRLAQHHGIPVPVNEMLTSRVRALTETD